MIYETLAKDVSILKKWLNNLLLIIFSIVFIASLWFLVDYYVESRKQKDTFDQLANLVDQYRPTAPQPTSPNNTTDSTDSTSPSQENDNPQDSTDPTQGNVDTPTTNPDYVEVVHPSTGETIKVLPEYARIFMLNSDVVGWMRIDGTPINYPVMQTPDRPNYYLKRDFNKASSSHGCLYAAEACDVMTPSDNITIYGHNMRDGSMFASLHNYKKQSYYEEHRFIYFDTITERHCYEIMSVFTTTASIGFGFDYHNFINAANEEEFDKFVSDCKLLSLYYIDVDADYGDSFITLSTCEYSQTNGRLVVVAKRIY